MTKNWIVVADASHARIFQAEDSHRHLRELHYLSSPESQMHTQPLRAGGDGALIDSPGSGPHQPAPQAPTPEKHSEHLARKLGKFLQQSLDVDAFAGVILVAEPSVLDHLQNKLDQRTAQLVIAAIDKNWVEHGTRQIEQLIEHYMSGAKSSAQT